jgi:hypothetical protein
MYCPQCGQQQASGEVRFCSRCGFLLDGVGLLLATKGVIPTIEAESSVRGMTPRRRGVRQGGLMMILGMIITPLLAILHEAIRLPEAFAILSAVLFFWGGFLRILYAAIFQEGELRRGKQGVQLPYVPPTIPNQIGAARSDAAGLPPGQGGMRAPSFMPPRGNTAEIVSPPSVAEHTTRLLDKQTDPADH